MLITKASAVRLSAVLISVALVAAACGGSGDSADAPIEATPSSDTDADSESTNADADDSGDDGTDGTDGTDTGDDSADTVEVIEDEPSTDPVSGGTLRYVLEADVDGINPTSSALSSPGLMMANAVFDTLAVFDTDGNWHPYLAESITPSDDFTSWTVTLRDGVSFHDATPLNSEALRVNFETVLNDPLIGLAVKPFYPAVDEGALEIIDDLSARFNLLEPNANWPSTVTTQLGYISSPTWLAAALEDPTLNQAPVGTGPFRWESRSEDSVTRFVRNDDWWNGAAYLDAVEFIPITDSNDRRDLLLAGEVDAIQTTQVAVVDELRNQDGIQAVLDDSGEEFYVMMNSSAAPFDDIRARKALTLATPRHNFLELIQLGLSQPADQMFTPSSPYYNDGVRQESDDPEAAALLVAEYCADFADNCTDAKIDMELQWSGPSVIQTRIGELLEQGWKDGFNVNFQELAQDAHIQETAFGLYDVVAWRGFGAVNPGDDQVWLLCRTIGGLSLNWARFCDEDRDAVLAELQLATTVAERTPLLHELTQMIHDEYLYVFMNHTMWLNAFADNVRGVCAHTAPDEATMRCSTNGRTWFSNVWLAE